MSNCIVSEGNVSKLSEISELAWRREGCAIRINLVHDCGIYKVEIDDMQPSSVLSSLNLFAWQVCYMEQPLVMPWALPQRTYTLMIANSIMMLNPSSIPTSSVIPIELAGGRVTGRPTLTKWSVLLKLHSPFCRYDASTSSALSVYFFHAIHTWSTSTVSAGPDTGLPHCMGRCCWWTGLCISFGWLVNAWLPRTGRHWGMCAFQCPCEGLCISRRKLKTSEGVTWDLWSFAGSFHRWLCNRSSSCFCSPVENCSNRGCGPVCGQCCSASSHHHGSVPESFHDPTMAMVNLMLHFALMATVCQVGLISCMLFK